MIMPQDDKLMRSQEELEAVKILPFLPATERDLLRHLRIGGNRIRAMLIGLQKQGLVKQQLTGLWVKVKVSNENMEGTIDRD